MKKAKIITLLTSTPLTYKYIARVCECSESYVRQIHLELRKNTVTN